MRNDEESLDKWLRNSNDIKFGNLMWNGEGIDDRHPLRQLENDDEKVNKGDLELGKQLTDWGYLPLYGLPGTERSLVLNVTKKDHKTISKAKDYSLGCRRPVNFVGDLFQVDWRLEALQWNPVFRWVVGCQLGALVWRLKSREFATALL